MSTREDLIKELLSTANGCKKLAISMRQPLRDRRDYASVGRKTFLVEQLPEYAEPLYEKELNTVAYVIGENGQCIMTVTISESNKFLIPLFKIEHKFPKSIKLEESFFDEARIAAKQIQSTEDQCVFAIVDAITYYEDRPTVSIEKDFLDGAFREIKDNGFPVDKVIMNPQDLCCVKEFITEEGYSLMPKQQKTYRYNDVPVLPCIYCPTGTIYVCTSPEHLGRIPVRRELYCYFENDEFVVSENIGIGAFNPKGIVKVQIGKK
jgi:hypothetical protein